MNKLLGLSVALLSGAISATAVADVNTQEYQIRFTEQAPMIDGSGTDTAWLEADTLTQFTFPWRPAVAPATEFKALWDAEAVYFRYRVSDDNIAIGTDPKRAILDSDRAEIFLAKDKALSTYYTMEIDPKARVFSAKAAYDSENKKIGSLDSSWKWPGLVAKSSTMDKGYIVEGKIPLSTLTSLELWQDSQKTELLCALMRAEFTQKPDGSLDMGWMTWIDPNTAKPNFHNPYTFGSCKLTKK
ncbi:carbohydrate-binding family 9-like protein [Vibrio renipiscarius]|uniref:Endoxylanase n=1 Tax=Vibrio renipiscarius TaxID=1461322 RepID=A0A0C2NME6_9VIBR|nr:carbohydrate-binding family 9-like protein [Vibrio renipiscarius]KII79752.1 endoxylanase [Vibrio renipiscarius]KII80621.1 endoxylanase [Vibrio renipiscarius]